VGILLFPDPPDSVVGEDEDGGYDVLFVASDPSRRYASSSMKSLGNASSRDN